VNYPDWKVGMIVPWHTINPVDEWNMVEIVELNNGFVDSVGKAWPIAGRRVGAAALSYHGSAEFLEECWDEFIDMIEEVRDAT